MIILSNRKLKEKWQCFNYKITHWYAK